MCGIIGFTGKIPATDFLINGLEKLEYRGYDSAGIALLNNKKFNILKTVNRMASLKLKAKNEINSTYNIGIGHTRWATHGPATLENAHPHISENSKFCVVHNGIIENYKQLKEELISEGYIFKSQTDTEVIAHLLQKYYTSDLKTAVAATVNRLRGSYALGILCLDHPQTLIAVKNFSPLVIGISENKNFLASDISAFAEHTKKVIYLDDGETAFISPSYVEIYDSCGCMTNKKIFFIDWDTSLAQKQDFEHFMLKEILEQPSVISNLLKEHIENNHISLKTLPLSKCDLEKFEKIEIVACGSAYNAGAAGKYILEDLLKIPVNTDLASEFRYRNPIINQNTLTILISQSGETADTLAALRQSKKMGSYVLSIVNVVGSSIAKESDCVLYTCAGPEIAVATTKGYSSQLIILYLFSLWAAEKLGNISYDKLTQLLNELATIPQKIQKILDDKQTIEEYAEQFYNNDPIIFIGRNIDYAVALEASLKLKEISYINSVAYAAGELKHGTISLIEKGTPVMALCGYNELFTKMLSNIKEVSARGARVLSCLTQDSTHQDLQIDFLSIPKTHPYFTASLEVIPFQLFAYFIAKKRGCDIDKPRNLAKSVTVE